MRGAPGSTVVQAYLYGTYAEEGGASTPLTGEERTINFDGSSVEMTEISAHAEGSPLPSTRADVTAQVAAKVGEGGAITTFGIDSDPSNVAGRVFLEGTALVVIYSDPSLPLESIAVLDGSASSAGDTATLDFTSPLDTTTSGFSASLAVGVGQSFQDGGPDHDCGPGLQDSTIDVDGERLTSCAGGSDDGSASGRYLVTVGGVGDSITNPSDPFTTSEGVEEDELYNLVPFLSNGDTRLTIDTANPSGDDDLFLAVVAITAEASVAVEGEVPPPPAPAVTQVEPTRARRPAGRR